MHVLIGIAIKSLFVAGLTLGLVQLMGKRSAAERSWVAHIGLLALVIMAFAPLVLPSWNVAMPGLFGRAVEPSSIAEMAPVAVTTPVPAASITHHIAKVSPLSSVTPATVATAVYAVPAAILLIITLLALAHLVALRARADVLVDGHWLSALARAQRRMGFKHGTALLTSDDLASPISWGLMRPVILLNSRAVEATGEAEAIIAHELAHVARMDWIKLLLARIATALFWFNPLVWMLAREAHQLREEAADDSVLAADIVDTDYAQLLVGVARHECPGLLLGAHGVAPSRSSLGRRVARVLDGASVRGPVARPFALGAFTGAVLIAAPLAALTLTPGGPRLAKPAPALTAKAGSRGTGYADAREVPADLPHIIARGVSTSVSTAVAAIWQTQRATQRWSRPRPRATQQSSVRRRSPRMPGNRPGAMAARTMRCARLASRRNMRPEFAQRHRSWRETATMSSSR
jgi:beta-lactamase regulating signal transducer with metallopeptidase domain